MTCLTEVPDEILLAFPLSLSDTASVIGVCKKFKDVLTSRLYECVIVKETDETWRIHPDNKPSAAPLFAALLEQLRSGHPRSANNVREVRLLAHQVNSTWSAEVEKIARDILVLLSPRLKSLILHPPNDQFDCWTTVQFPQLRHLTITTPLRFDASGVIHLASQSSIRHIEIQREEPGETFYPVVDPVANAAYRADIGKELILRQADLDTDQLKKLIQVYGDVGALIYIKNTSYCQWDDLSRIREYPDEGCKTIRVEKLNHFLHLNFQTLEKLVLIQSNIDQCEWDYSILESLSFFVRLCNLQVEAHFLLGYHKAHAEAPSHDAEISTRDLSSLTGLLPASLERLHLLVRPQELFHHTGYCTNIVLGLVEHRDNLPRLEFVTVEEAQYENWLRGPWPGQSPVTEAMIRDMQNSCGAAGIRMVYIKCGWEHNGLVVNSGLHEGPFDVKVFEPGANVKDTWFRWRNVYPLNGTLVTNLDFEDSESDCSEDGAIPEGSVANSCESQD